jgi:hypothetical protein
MFFFVTSIPGLGPAMFGATSGLAPVELTGLPGFKSSGSEAGSSDSVGCVGFWFAVFVVMGESVLN